MKTKLKWSTENRKLIKTKTVSFGLPAIEACPQAGICASVCYATQGGYTYPATRAARTFNFTYAKDFPQAFEEALHSDMGRILKSGRFNNVRVHDGGDFFNQAYLDTWFFVARAYPTMKFYAYTKSLHLDFGARPENFVVIQSQGGKLDHLIDKRKPHSRIFATVKDRKKAGYVDGNKNDGPAQRGEHLIGLVYHGTKNLTDVQKRTFGA